MILVYTFSRRSPKLKNETVIIFNRSHTFVEKKVTYFEYNTVILNASSVVPKAVPCKSDAQVSRANYACRASQNT